MWLILTPQRSGRRQPLLASDYHASDDMRIQFAAGILPQADRLRFERMLFRATRGNCYVRCQNIDAPMVDPRTGQSAHKLVFLVFFKSEAVGAKVSKICEAFSANTYPVPDLERMEEIGGLLENNYSDLNDARVVLKHNHSARYQLCMRIAQHVEEWTWIVVKEKSTYHTLNSFRDDVRGCLRGEGWVVAAAYDEAVAVANRAGAAFGSASVAMHEVRQPSGTPPTHFRTNKFTYAYQEFVNTYGVPRYREINPALFTAVTFPFLFGIMYGDVGHGLCLFLAGAFLVLRESAHDNQKLSELMGAMHSGRYMLLMMGAFAVYAGLLYNDCFSLGLDLFGTNFRWAEDPGVGDAARFREGCESGDPDCVYPFGIDPAWKIAQNELAFYNSLKMKVSVILGVSQMTFGVGLKTMNAVYNGEWLDVLFECIPMFVFDLCFFGYMCILIFIKWGIDWNQRMFEATCVEGFLGGDEARPCDVDAVTTTAERCPYDFGGEGDGCQPPNIIATLIDIVLNIGNVAEPMYAGQGDVQTALVLLMFLSVPVLLLAKPLILRHQHSTHGRRLFGGSDTGLAMLEEGGHGFGGGGGGGGGGGHGHGHGEEFNFGEIMIHQAIETIEFVLGMLSNTASYLRLWALSLAHTELATVFWEKAMLAGIASNNAFFIFIAYAVFAAVTAGVLLCMDTLEAFLHALRLHWVEFQNKFYKADGYRFVPFDFRAIIKDL